MRQGPLPILLLILDGIGDRPCPELGGLTPLEAARTPHLDALAAQGASGSLYPLGPGRVPSSELAHFAFFGYPPDLFPGRAVLEGLGRDRKIPEGAIVGFAALRSVVRREDGFAVTGRYREAEDAEGIPLMAEVEAYEAEGVSLRLDYLDRGEALLFLTGGAGEEVTDSDPFFHTGHSVIAVQPLVGAADPGRAARTADALNAYLLWAHGRLEAHPVNAGRRGAGLRPLNFVVTKWMGRRKPLPSFEDRTGMAGAVVASAPVYAGLAALVGLQARLMEAEDPGADLRAKLETAAALLQAGADFIHVHTKAADEAAHTHDPHTKREVIEALDDALGPLAAEAGPFAEVLVGVTADHCTPTRGPQLHSGDSVPLVVRGATVRRDQVERFGERACVGGALGQLVGGDLLPLLLNLADRGAFLGGRPSPIPILGMPRRVLPLRPA